MDVNDRVVQRLPWGMQTVSLQGTAARGPSNGGAVTWGELTKIVEKKHGIKVCAQTLINASQSAMQKIKRELIKKYPELEGSERQDTLC